MFRNILNLLEYNNYMSLNDLKHEFREHSIMLHIIIWIPGPLFKTSQIAAHLCV